MSDKLQKLFQLLPPFILIGVVIALIFSIIGMFFYIAFWGLIIGAVLWLITLVKQYFFSNSTNKTSSGRIIEHDDKKN